MRWCEKFSMCRDAVRVPRRGRTPSPAVRHGNRGNLRCFPLKGLDLDALAEKVPIHSDTRQVPRQSHTSFPVPESGSKGDLRAHL